MAPLYKTLVLLLYYFSSNFCSSTDIITATQILKYPNFITSANGTFKLGVFSTPNSSNRYVGIWFNNPVIKIVWVANRENPITDTSGLLQISENGHLQLLNGLNTTIWSTNGSSIPISNNNTNVHLLDTGNLVLVQSNSSRSELDSNIIWQSFDHPTDTFLPGMQPTFPSTPNKNHVIFTSWRSPIDPSMGSFSVGIGTKGLPQVLTWHNNDIYWRSGPWDGNSYIGLPNVDNTLKDGFVMDKESETIAMIFAPEDVSLLFSYVIDYKGYILEPYWDDGRENWTEGWSAPSVNCEVYGTCGVFGTCDYDHSVCKCLQGFQPTNLKEWKKGNWKNGCVRRVKLQCGIQGGNHDGFLRLLNMKVPDNIVKLSAFSDDGCRSQCLNNCSCLAYSYHLNIGCMIWSKDLIDTQTFSAGGVDLFLRMGSSELGNKAFPPGFFLDKFTSGNIH